MKCRYRQLWLTCGFSCTVGTIVLTLSSRLSTRLIENLNITIAFGEDVVYADGTATDGSLFWFDPDTQVPCPFSIRCD